MSAPQQETQPPTVIQPKPAMTGFKKGCMITGAVIMVINLIAFIFLGFRAAFAVLSSKVPVEYGKFLNTIAALFFLPLYLWREIGICADLKFKAAKL